METVAGSIEARIGTVEHSVAMYKLANPQKQLTIVLQVDRYLVKNKWIHSSSAAIVNKVPIVMRTRKLLKVAIAPSHSVEPRMT